MHRNYMFLNALEGGKRSQKQANVVKIYDLKNTFLLNLGLLSSTERATNKNLICR